MPIALKTPIKKKFFLTKSDELFEAEGEPTYVIIRQARQGDFESRNALNNQISRVYDGKEIKMTQRISPDDERRREVFLTLCGSNIKGEDGNLLFKFTEGVLTNEDQFNQAWSKLEPFMAEEIHLKVLAMNPLWNTLGLVTGEEEDEIEEGTGEPKSGEGE